MVLKIACVEEDEPVARDPEEHRHQVPCREQSSLSPLAVATSTLKT